MSTRAFAITLLLVSFAAGWVLFRQRKAIVLVENALITQQKGTTPSATNIHSPANANPPSGPRPSSELLKLRGEVTLLRQELEAVQSAPSGTPVLNPEVVRDEWSFVYSGPKPSEFPDYFQLSELKDIGFATPRAAFQSFQHAFRTTKRNLTPTEMKELWDVADDYDDPDAGYNIHLGDGIGREVGARIVSEEYLSSNVVRLTVDFERPDGSSFRREHTLVERQGRWRMQPAGLSRK
jgi:hypothetical protein